MVKWENIILLIVGYVIKDGVLVGFCVLEYLVDMVLYFEGDCFVFYCLLCFMKNCFGVIYEIGVFEMVVNGLKEILNLLELFFGSRDEYFFGIFIVVLMEGICFIVVEI